MALILTLAICINMFELNHHRLKPAGLDWLLKQPKVVPPQSYRFSFALLNLDSLYILVLPHLLHSHYLQRNILLPTNAFPKILYSILCIPSVISETYSLSCIALIYSLTDGVVLIPADVCGPSPHDLPVSPHRLSGILFVSVPLSLGKFFPSVQVFGTSLSIQYGILPCNPYCKSPQAPPVTFCKGLSNQIHRKFTFQGKKNKAGNLFLDSRPTVLLCCPFCFQFFHFVKWKSCIFRYFFKCQHSICQHSFSSIYCPFFYALFYTLL